MTQNQEQTFDTASSESSSSSSTDTSSSTSSDYSSSSSSSSSDSSSNSSSNSSQADNSSSNSPETGSSDTSTQSNTDKNDSFDSSKDNSSSTDFDSSSSPVSNFDNGVAEAVVISSSDHTSSTSSDSNSTPSESKKSSSPVSTVNQTDVFKNTDSESSKKEVFGYKLATNGERFVAALIDGIIVGFVASVISKFLGYDFFINLGISFAYFGYMESQESGATVGKQVMKIKVVSAENGQVLEDKSYTRAAYRLVSGIILGIGFLLAFFDPKNQTLHDQLAKTYVVKEKADS